MIYLALSVDASENQDDTASVTFDFGNIGPEARPFDRSREPSAKSRPLSTAARLDNESKLGSRNAGEH